MQTYIQAPTHLELYNCISVSMWKYYIVCTLNLYLMLYIKCSIFIEHGWLTVTHKQLELQVVSEIWLYEKRNYQLSWLFAAAGSQCWWSVQRSWRSTRRYWTVLTLLHEFVINNVTTHLHAWIASNFGFVYHHCIAIFAIWV